MVRGKNDAFNDQLASHLFACILGGVNLVIAKKAEAATPVKAEVKPKPLNIQVKKFLKNTVVAAMKKKIVPKINFFPPLIN